jgi:hypothetical protein
MNESRAGPDMGAIRSVVSGPQNRKTVKKNYMIVVLVK